MMLNRPVRVAVVGLGDFGRRHARSFAAHPGSELVGVVGRDPAGTAAFASELGSVTSYTSLERMLEEEQPDAVAIATPGALHLQMASSALRAGTHVLLEKPTVPTTAEIEPLRKLVANSRGFVMPAHVLRFAEPYREVARRIRAGRIGEPLAYSFRRFRSIDHDVRFPDVHPVYMTAIHDIDLAIWYGARDFRQVKAVSVLGQGTAQPSAVSFIAQANSRATVSFSVAWTLPDESAEDSFEVLGTKGMIALDHEYRLREISIGSVSEVVEFPRYELNQALDAEIDHFIRCVAAGAPSDQISLEEAFLGLGLAERAVRAGQVSS